MTFGLMSADQAKGGQVEDFRFYLDKFRNIYPVKTICMHGSPLSKYDNRLLWEKYDYYH